MKPLHIGLLVIGAALAGALAVKMTEYAPAPSKAVSRSAPVRVSAPPIPAAAPAPAPSLKPRSIPEKTNPFHETIASAPRAIYVQPAITQRARKNEPIGLMAKLISPPPYVPQIQAQPETTPTPSLPDPDPPRQVTLRPGMICPIRLDQSLSTERSVAGDSFQASLAEPFVVNGLVIAEKGARVAGRVVDVRKPGRMGGKSMIRLELIALNTSDGQRVPIATEPWAKEGESSPGSDVATIGTGAAIGAIIGAIAGGGAGAAIGAGVGGGAGLGAAAINHGKPVNVSSETLIRFRLTAEETITEQR